jgi:thiol-disulfide isomerase/thioredoxin
MIKAQTSTFTLGGQFTNTEGFEKLSVVAYKDSLHIIKESFLKDGNFTIQLQNLESGIYRLQYGPNQFQHFLDFIVTPEDSSLFVQMDLLEDKRTPLVTGSSINQELYSYLNEQDTFIKQLRFYYQTYHSAPDKTQKTAVMSKSEFEKMYNSFEKKKIAFIKKNESNFAGLYVKANPVFVPKILLSPEQVNQNRFANYWDKLPLNETLLQNTPFYYTYLIEYLGHHFSQQIPPQVWDAQMKQAIDTLMNAMSINKYSKLLALQNLLDGLRKMQHESLLKYVDEKYAQQSECLEATLQEDVNYRLKSYEIGNEGQEVPNFLLKDKQDFYSVLKGKSVLMFWSSTCPHCMEEWTIMESWKKNHPEFQLIAISLDTDKIVYEEAIKKLPKDIVFICDFKGYESSFIKPFYIMATPTFFEIDQNKKFVKKGKTINQLEIR